MAASSMVDLVGATTSALGPAFTGQFHAYGLYLLGCLGVIRVSWLGLEIALNGGVVGSTFAAMIRAALLISLVAWFMPGASSAGPLISTITSLSSALAGGDMSAEVAKVGNQFMTEAARLAGFVQQIVKPDGANMLDALFRMVQMFVPILFTVIALLLVFAASALFSVAMAASGILTLLATALAPLFIPWLVVSQTSFLFDGWLRFLLAAAMWKVVASLLCKLTGGLLAGLSAAFGGLTTSAAGGNMAIVNEAVMTEITKASVATAGAALLICWLMLKASEIASALVSGSASFSTSGLASRATQGMTSAISAARTSSRSNAKPPKK